MQPLRVKAYRPTFIEVSRRQLEAVGQGIRAAGDEFSFAADLDEEADVALMVSGLKFPGSPLCAAREKIIRRFAGRILVSETPFFRQGAQPHEGPDPYFRLSVGGFMRDDGQFYPPEFKPYPARWQAIKEEQSLEIAPWLQKDGSYVLICMQKPSDASLRGIDTHVWTRQTSEALLHFTSLPVVIRPHPLDRTPFRAPDDKRCIVSHNDKLGDDLERAHAVVTYSSLAAIEAVLAGVPTFCLDPGNHAWPVSLKRDIHRLALSLDDMGHQRIERDEWLWGLAWSQWRLSELREGWPWQRLRPLLT